jgi:hypothetical protein
MRISDLKWRWENFWNSLTQPKLPRLVVVDCPDDPHYCCWKNGEILLLLAEIQNLRNHYVVVSRDGKVHYGYHNDFFREPTQDEL